MSSGLDRLFALLLAAVEPLDRARRVALAACAPWVGTWMRDRHGRAAALAILALVTSIALVVLAPAGVAVLGPLLFGVPHIVGDLRYLVIRPSLRDDRLAFGIVVVGTLGAALVGARATGPSMLLLAFVSMHRGPGARALLPLGLALTGAAVLEPRLTEVVFAHAHHAISLAAWWMLWARADRRAGRVLAALALAMLLLAAGVFDALLARTFATSWFDVAPERLVRSIAPGLEGPLALRVVTSFLVLQSLHYTLWIRLVPELSRERTAPRGFRTSLLALRRDLGVAGVFLAIGVASGVLALAAFGAWRARNLYLAAASFHGHLELLALSAVLVRSRSPRHLAPFAPRMETT